MLAICLHSIKSDEFLRIFSKHLYFSQELAVEPSVFVKQPIKGWNHIVHTIYPENKLKTCNSASVCFFATIAGLD